MSYSFLLEDAIEYGLEEAIILYNFYFWIEKNKANRKHFHDERTWTYNSQRALQELFPFWSRQNIRRIIKSLKEKQLIRTGNYNNIPYDKTTWYALEDESLLQTLGWNQPIEKTESTNRSEKGNQAIPDINTDIKQDKENVLPFEKPKTIKKEHLDFVRLTIEEFDKLSTDYGQATVQDFIERLNDYIGSKGKKYKSHYFTIKNWMRRDGVQKKEPVKKMTAEQKTAARHFTPREE